MATVKLCDLCGSNIPTGSPSVYGLVLAPHSEVRSSINRLEGVRYDDLCEACARDVIVYLKGVTKV